MADKRVTLLLEARDKASKHVMGLRKSLTGLGSTIKSVGKMSATFGAAAVGAAVLGLGELTRRQFGAIDASAKFADEVGVSTEALAGYQHAAELTGTSQETLNKGLQRMVRRLGEASRGYGEGKKGLEALGLSADQIAKKSPENALLDISDAIKGMKTPAEQAAAAYSLFGRQGQEMLTFLKLGSTGLRDTAAEADALGLTFSRMDAAKIEMANDAITRLKAVMKGVGQQLAIAVAPGIQDITEQIQKLPIKAIGQTIARTVKLGIEGIRSISRWIGELIQKIPGVSDVLANLEFHVKNLPEHFNVWIQKGRVVAMQLKDLLAGVGEYIGTNGAIIADRLVKNWKTMFHNVQQLGKNLVNNFGPIMENLREVFSRVIKAIPDLNMAAFEDFLTITGHAIKGVGVKFKELPKLLEVAFKDMGKIAIAGWKAIESGSLTPFDNLDLGLGTALKDLDGKMADHWGKLNLDDSKLKKRLEQLAIEAGKPLLDMGGNIAEGLKKIDTSSLAEHMKPFQWVESEATRQAKEAHALATATLERNRQLYDKHSDEAKKRTQKAIKDLQLQQSELDDTIKGASEAGRSGFQGSQLGERFEGLLEQFKMGREVVQRQAVERKAEPYVSIFDRSPEDVQRGVAAAGAGNPVPTQVIERTREVVQQAVGNLSGLVQQFRDQAAASAPLAVAKIAQQAVASQGWGTSRPAAGPTPQMQTIARETQAGLVPMQETASNTRAMNAKLDRMAVLLQRIADKPEPKMFGAAVYPFR